jgi:molybdopterin molybdotransferase
MRTGIAVEEARRLVLDGIAPLPPETVTVPDALGRVLAVPVTAGRTLPPADCSAMDGYALRAADLAGATRAAPRELALAFEVAAGAAAPRPLRPGEAARIFTGAPLPEGADSIVMQEDTEASGARVRFFAAPAQGEHVRAAGEDVRAGETVLEAGTRLGAAQLGLLASLGRSFVPVHRRPRVAILSGGDELVEPDQDAAGGRIVASNAWSLAAQCAEAGALATNLGIARDTEQDLERLLRAGLASDVLLSSAGVSVGDHDHVRPVLEKLGCRLVFWGVEMKPGYPFTFGRFDEGPRARSAGTGAGPLVFGLPGNPVSALVSFEQFVRPALLRLAGRRTLTRPLLRVQLGETLRKKAGRLHFVRVTLAREGERFVARSTGNQSSGVLRSMALAQGLLVFPAAATELAAGSSADVQLLDADVLAAPEPDPG